VALTGSLREPLAPATREALVGLFRGWQASRG